MKKVYAIAAVVLLLGLSSCLSTVQPIFTEKDLVFDPRLLGKWGYVAKGQTDSITPETVQKLGKQHTATVRDVSMTRGVTDVKVAYKGYIEITKATAQDVTNEPALQKLLGKIYLIRNTDENEVTGSLYYGFLVKLGQKYYMDYYPAETASMQQYNDFYKSHYVKMHTCYSIRFLNDFGFELKQFDEKFMRELVENKKIRIRHELRDDGTFVVTASTEELQQYIMKYSDVPEAYYSDNTSIYTRILSH